MKKKGFTLIELIGVVILIAMISILAVPPIINSIQNTKSDLSKVSESLLVSTADLFMSQNVNRFPKTNGNVYCITLRDLASADLIQDPFYDAVSGEEINLNNKIEVTVTNNNYDYKMNNSCRENIQSTDLLLKDVILRSTNAVSDKDIDFTKISTIPVDYVETFDDAKKTYDVSQFTEFQLGNAYTFDTKTGKYTITSATKATTWDPTYATTYKYFCGTNAVYSTCFQAYEMDSTSTATATTVTAYLHDGIVNQVIDNGNGLFYNDNGEDISYYFRGNMKNNYLEFAGKQWKILRINADSSIRIIMTESIPSVKYNTTVNDQAYVGYMIGTTGATTYAGTHTNSTDSNLKTTLENYYKNNFLAYDAYIADSGFCGDRSLYNQNGYTEKIKGSVFGSSYNGVDDTGLGYGKNTTFYGGFYRAYYGDPIFGCINDNDLYTVDIKNGNGKQKYPIGLITSDEAIFAGAAFRTLNSNYFLYMEKNPWWTMTPGGYVNQNSSAGGLIGSTGITVDEMNTEASIKPVINLASDVEWESGNGTEGQPYKIKMNK